MFRGMWRRPIRYLVLVLVGLAFLGGTTVQAMPPSGMAGMGMASTPMPGCMDAAMAHDTGAPTSHQGITPDCLKMTQCLGVPAMPVQARLAAAPVAYAAVAYWSPYHRLSGRSPEPTPFPPRSA